MAWLALFVLANSHLSLAFGSDPAATAQQKFEQAKETYQMHREDAEAAWKFGRAAFDYSDIVPGNSQRATIAQQGIEACRQALERSPGSGPLHYYLALNLGELARTKTLGALKLVDQMENELTTAINLDPKFDYAGAERSLGMLYRDAPVLASIGSKSKARLHLQRALDLAPDFPENRLSLIESELKWGDRKAARHELKTLENGWQLARKQFAGPQWASSWTDWEERLDKVKKSLDEPARLETPRH